jgi:hypothetical protein
MLGMGRLMDTSDVGSMGSTQKMSSVCSNDVFLAPKIPGCPDFFFFFRPEQIQIHVRPRSSGSYQETTTLWKTRSLIALTDNWNELSMRSRDLKDLPDQGIPCIDFSFFQLFHLRS